MKRYIILLTFIAVLDQSAIADMIPMRDFKYLQRGMTEAEVLYRVGPSDHQSVYSDRYNYPLRKIWYYIPEKKTSQAWITEIEFNRSGIVQSLNRYRSRK